MGSIGRSLDAKGRCRRAVINVTRRNSGRICTTGAGFAQADQTYNVSPNAKEKSPVPHLIKIPPKATGLSHAYFQSHLADSRTGFTRSVRSYPANSNLISIRRTLPDFLFQG